MQIDVFVQSYLCGTPKRAGLRHSGNVTPIPMMFSIIHVDVHILLAVNRACCLVMLSVCNYLAHVRRRRELHIIG